MSRTVFKSSLSFKTTALLALGLVSLAAVPIAAHAQAAQVSQKPVLTTLHHFDGAHGAVSNEPLTLGADGNFYGVTQYGGLSGKGTIFSITLSGAYTTLWRFKGKNGEKPDAPLVQGADGAFYGTTQVGGPDDDGTAFRITPDGKLTTLHSFHGPDGIYPSYGGLTLAADGSFYGLTYMGGANNKGTVFHMTADGMVTTLHAFNSSEGNVVLSRLVFGPDGALYGATQNGGANTDGLVFRITTAGAFSVLHSFNSDEGYYAGTGLTVGPDGALYGTASFGGIGNTSTIYKITTPGKFTLLHKFSHDGHGQKPYAALTLGADGNFYGTTGYGGFGENTGIYTGNGTVFQMTPTGHVTTLYKFHTAFDGNTPYGGVVFGPDGALYGTTNYGGVKGNGTIYKLTLP